MGNKVYLGISELFCHISKKDESIQMQGHAFVSKTADPPKNCETVFWKAVAQRTLRSLQLVASTLGHYFI